jgi:hypothetical protein
MRVFYFLHTAPLTYCEIIYTLKYGTALQSYICSAVFVRN